MEKNSQEVKRIHFNVPQLLFWLVRAKINICLWGRATGKTEGPGAMFTMANMNAMPRSLGGIVSNTYDKLLTMIIPGLVKGWEKFGYLENVHFFVRKYPPVGYFQNEPFRAPKKPDHYLPWWNGAGAILMSLDRPATSPGVNLDWMYIDEGRLIKKQRAYDAMLTVRGNAEHFGHLANHGSVLITSDLPKDSNGAWLLEYAEEMDAEVVNLILGLQSKIMELNQGYDDLTKKQRAVADREIDKLNAYINDLRMQLVYVSYASTFDNVHALGMDALKSFKRLLSDLDFQVSVANKRIRNVEHGFYALLSEDHLYDAGDFDFMDSLEVDFLRDSVEKDSRWDADVNRHEPLDIGLDYNFKISCMAIGQSDPTEDRTLNFLYVEHPEQLKDLVKKFCRYYRHHGNKTVNYYYDHTAMQGRSAVSDVSFCDEVVKYFELEDWTVNRYYIGQAMGHKSRYLMFGKMFKGNDPDYPRQRFNRANTELLYNAMKNAGTRQTGKTFEKDKRPESDPNVPPVEAPHPTEAWDMLATGKHSEKFKYGYDFVDTM